MNIFSATTIPIVEQAMNGSMAEQNVLAQNIANVDTPNYKAKQVAFDDVFNNALTAEKTNPKHLSFSSDDEAGYRIENDSSGAVQNNGNNVDIDAQMSNLAKNQLRYQALEQAVSNQFQQFNTVLGGK
ncbi:flagellar basal body rod protein FlgB [Terrilactibacillus sp. S3-3]|nr:flagellar basal body rod protein FlgB [Terrilactibacillus sp. S3-3]